MNHSFTILSSLPNFRLCVVVAFISSFMLYGNTLNNDYTQDDAIVIYDNMFTTQGVKGIPGLLSNDTFFGFFKESGKNKLVSGGRYRPLTPVMFAIEFQLFGNNPFYGHLFNVIWYGILGIAIFLTLLLLLSHVFSLEKSLIFSISVTLLYMAHPLHTEVVANIKGRDEIIAMLGSIIVLFLSFKDKNTLLQKSLISFVFFLACLAKENAITFLAIVPLALILFKKSSLKSAIIQTVPLFVGAFIFMAIRTYILGFDLGGAPLELMNNPYLKFVGNQYIPFSIEEKIATIATTLLKYLQLLLFPIVLTHDYYPRHIDIMSFKNLVPLASVAIHIVLIIIGVLNLNKNKLISFSIFFYLITLSIVSNVVFPVGTNMSERFMFMPSFGFILLLVFYIHKFSFDNRKVFFAIIALIFFLYSIKTITRNQVWVNDFTLFTTDVKTSTKSAKVLNAAGGALTTKAYTEKNETKKKQMLQQAIQYLNEATNIHPTYKNAYLIKGNAYYFLNELEPAIKSYEFSLQLDPNYADAAKNLAVALRDAGRIAGEKEGNLEKSITLLTRSIQFSNTDSETYRLLGIANGIQGNHEKAITNFLKVVELSPENAGAYLNLSNAYNYNGDIVNARKSMDKALSLDPTINK